MASQKHALPAKIVQKYMNDLIDDAGRCALSEGWKIYQGGGVSVIEDRRIDRGDSKMSNRVCGFRTTFAVALSIATAGAFAPAAVFAADCSPNSAAAAGAQTQAAGVPIDRQHFEGQMQAAGATVNTPQPGTPGVPIDRQHFEGQMQPSGATLNTPQPGTPGVPIDRQHFEGQMQPAGAPIDQVNPAAQAPAADSDTCK